MPVKIFFCYAHEDEPLLNKLKTHLRPLQHQELIDVWYDRDISAGIEWEQEISQHLQSAQIILLLVSPDFMDSDYCYSNEMKRAIERHETGEVCVIPVILRPVDWYHAPFSKFQVLPTSTKPVTNWHGRNGRDRAFLDIAIGIRKVIEERWARSNIKNELQIQNLKHTTGEYTISVNLNPSIALIHVHRADILFEHRRYFEALDAYNLAISLEPNYAYAHKGKGDTLLELHYKVKALESYRKAITIDSNIEIPMDREHRTCPSCKYLNKPFIIYCTMCGADMGLPLKKEPDS